jgi:hypothetical protein
MYYDVDPRLAIAKYFGHDVTQVPLEVEGVQENYRERSSSEFTSTVIFIYAVCMEYGCFTL